MQESKRVYGTQAIEYCWDNQRPLAFITTWGERGDTLWLSPTYNSGTLEKARARWGMSNNGAQNHQTWMDRIVFKQYSNSIYAVNEQEGIDTIVAVEAEVLALETEVAALHTKLQQTKQKRTQLYREVCKKHSKAVTVGNLTAMRDHAHSVGPNTVIQFKTQSALDKE